MSGYFDRMPIMRSGSLGSLTTTGANETARSIAPSGISVPLLQAKILTAKYSVAEVWVPVGVWYTVTTGITVTDAVITLRKNGVSPTSGGTATLPIAAASVNEKWAVFSSWVFAAADAAADAWSVLVSTTSTAGVVNPVVIGYALRMVGGVTDGVTL